MEQHRLSQPTSHDSSGLDSSVFEAQLKLVSRMDSEALESMLTALHHLPEHDPARYVITQSAEIEATLPVPSGTQTAYELGVAFGRSLTVRSHKDDTGYLPPVVTDVNETKKQLVDSVLAQSRRKKVKRILNGSDEANRMIESAAGVFTSICWDRVPDRMFQVDRKVSEEALRRGIHDYLAVVSVLEAPAPEVTKRSGSRLGRSVTHGIVGISFLGQLFSLPSKADRSEH